MTGPRRLFDWFCRDRRTGRITIAQFPNVPLWIFLITVGLRYVVPADSVIRTTVDWIGLAALIWWALAEVVRGVNPFRRLLGVGGIALCILKLVSMLR